MSYSFGGSQFVTGPVFNNLASGTYAAQVKDVVGCMARLDVVVPLTNDLGVDAGTDKTICEGASTDLQAISAAKNFSWTPSTGLSQASGPRVSANPLMTTKYYVTATLGPCSRNDSVTIFVNPAPVAVTGNGVTICYGQSAMLKGSGGVSCTWSPTTYLDDARSCSPTVTRPVNNITYSLRVKDALGCSSLLPATEAITVTPPAKLFAGNDTAIAANQPFRLNAIDVNNSGFSQFAWSPALGLNDPSIKNPVAVIDGPVTYTVTGTTPAGCQGIDNIQIKVYLGPEIYVPNAFSPNGDNHNDVLKAIPVGIKEFRFFAVYNRWGQRVFYTTNSSVGWNGHLGPNSQSTNTFAWKAAGVDDNGKLVERQGVVMLVR